MSVDSFSNRSAKAVQKVLHDATHVPRELRKPPARTIVDPGGTRTLLVKRTGDVDIGETETFQVYNPSTEVATGAELEVYLRLGAYISEEWAYAAKINGIQWEVVNTTCG